MFISCGHGSTLTQSKFLRCAVIPGVRQRGRPVASLTVGAKASDGTVIDKPKSDDAISFVRKPTKSPMYRVLLHNDNTNKREYVVKVLLKVVAGMTVETAVAAMTQAHQSGVGLVTVTGQDLAEQYVGGLRRNGLTSTLEPDNSGCGGQ